MMRGGVSHLESFDPKPASNRYAGKTIAESRHKATVFDSPYIKNVREQVANNIIDKQKARIYPLQIGFRNRAGRAGSRSATGGRTCGGCVDDIAVIRSMYTTDNNHGAQLEFLTGRHLLDGCHPDDRRLDPLRARVAERRPAAVHLDGACARVAVLRRRRLRLPRPRARGGRAQGRSERTRCRSRGRACRVGRSEAPIKADAPGPAEPARRRRVSRRRQAASPDQVVRAGLPDADGGARGPATSTTRTSRRDGSTDSTTT